MLSVLCSAWFAQRGLLSAKAGAECFIILFNKKNTPVFSFFLLSFFSGMPGTSLSRAFNQVTFIHQLHLLCCRTSGILFVPMGNSGSLFPPRKGQTRQSGVYPLAAGVKAYYPTERTIKQTYGSINIIIMSSRQH